MDSKLTLKLNQKVIEEAKKFAAKKNLSVSRLVENYLDTLTKDSLNQLEISPFVKSITNGSKIPLNIDSKKEYYDYLSKKYN